jgi:hypothetical protein
MDQNADRQVEIQHSSIARAWRQSGGGDTWLQLRTRAGSIEDFATAVEQANEAAAAGGYGADIVGAFPASMPRGYAVQLIRATTLALVRNWVSDLATALAERGFAGKLGGAPEVGAIPCLFASEPPVPTGYVVWTLDPSAMQDERRRAAAWLVSPEATVRIAELADRWARRPGADIVLRQNLYSLAVQLENAAPHLAQSVTETGLAGLDFILDKNECATHTALAFGGEGVFQLIGGPKGWRQRINRLTEALTALPADTNQAYIRLGHRGKISHNAIHVLQPLPYVEEYHVRYNKHLLDRYLPDAHGVQVVRDAHLAKAHDLSGWQVTELGHGRHLVQAPDLAPWYANGLPDPDTLARARADFAGALLTEQIVKDNPSPW